VGPLFLLRGVGGPIGCKHVVWIGSYLVGGGTARREAARVGMLDG